MNIQKQWRSIFISVGLTFLSMGYSQQTKVTVRVSDADTGDPVAKANVGLSVHTSIQPGLGWGGGKSNRYFKETDEKGVCTLSGKGNGGSASIFVRKDGFYGASGHVIDFTGTTGFFNRKWIPWNPTVDVAIKKIGNPIPLYAKHLRKLKLPVENRSIGFDLLVGDFVSPYGEGKISDFIFQMNRKPEKIVPIKKVGRYGKETLTIKDVTLTVKGSNEGDGFILVPRTPVGHGPISGLHLPREAPLEGYQHVVSKRAYNTVENPMSTEVREDANYFFRVRTVKDKDGNIVSALYGKIHGDFEFVPHQEKKVSFIYYLNPEPNNRNLEFDTDKNLFKNLSESEKVRRH